MTNPVDIKTGLTQDFLRQFSWEEEVVRYTKLHLNFNLYYLVRLDLPIIMPLKQKLETLR